MDDPRLPAFVRRMLRPDFYPHPVVEPIRLVQTHVSFVFLTGPFAYKVKKAVNLGFLDYSTLEKRLHFCREEVRLNARGAPGLYVDVVPVSETPDDPPVDYAVRMRQFPTDALYSSRLERGAFGVREAQLLLRTLARYHAAAPSDERVRSFGEPARVQAAVEQNFAQTERFATAGGPPTREQFEQTRDFTRGFFKERDALLRARVTGRHVRECHGDLHLDNVCEWEGQVLLFDCIEFNDAFRFVDTCYDLAFAAMDLEARGRPDLASLFVNVYLERTGDWEAATVLPLYLCRQAYVRGKVNSFLTEESEAGDEARRCAAERAGHYYRLAWDYARRFGTGRTGRLILMSGPSGSGKSVIAGGMRRRLGTTAVHVRSDAVRKHLAGVPLDTRAGPEAYTPEMTARTYQRLLSLGLDMAEVGLTAILDAKYDRRDLRGDAIEAATARGLPLHIVSCAAPDDVLRDRLRGRQGDVSDATEELVEAQRSAAEPFTDAERSHVVSPNAGRLPEEQAEDALAALGLAPPL